MRGSIFIKMFAGFWIVSVVVLGSWMLTNQYFDDRPEARHSGHQGPGESPHRAVLRLIYSLQNAPTQELPSILKKARDKHGVEVFLLDPSGSELLGRKPPQEVLSLAAELQGSQRRVFRRSEKQPMAAHKIYRPEVGLLRAVIVFPPLGHQVLGILSENLWLRLLLAMVISGLACYGLSRLMTNRLRDLQLASRKLANGELDTRLEVRERGGDETDELSRDFNTMAEQLQQRILAQKRLLGDVSHELRSPLARLRIALALAQENPQQQSGYLARIEQETERLEELIGQLLSTQQDRLEFDKHIDLVSLLQQLCADASFEGKSTEKQVRLTTTLRQAIVASTGDLLHKSFDNIIRNALRHTQAKSCVDVSISRCEGGYRVCIEDRGPGVPEAQLGKLFDEFYRVDTARTREDGGHGLGLAIARRAVQSHGGSVDARNTGNGLLVSVTLPVEQ